MTTLIGPGYRSRLEDCRARKRTAIDKVAAAKKGLELAQKSDDNGSSLAAQAALEQARGELAVAQELELTLLKQASGISGVDPTTFLDDPRQIAALEQLANSSGPIGRLELGQAVDRDRLLAMIQTGQWGGPTMATAGQVTTGNESRSGPYYGIAEQLRRRIRLLDLIPSEPMSGRSFDYSQEQGSLDTAAETVEGSLKPQGEADYVDKEAVAKTIAHYVKSKRQTLADVPTLQTTVQNRLTYGVLRRLEKQILAGDGTGENISGILAQAGIGNVPFVGTSALTDLSLDGITAVMVADAEPNAVVLHPTDLATMLKARATAGGDRLDSAGAFAAVPSTIWGLPAIVSTVITVGTALVGDFTNGCTIFVREGVNVRVSDSDQDDFLRNQLTLLGEGRFALAIWQVGAFARVHLV